MPSRRCRRATRAPPDACRAGRFAPDTRATVIALTAWRIGAEGWHSQRAGRRRAAVSTRPGSLRSRATAHSRRRKSQSELCFPDSRSHAGISPPAAAAASWNRPALQERVGAGDRHFLAIALIRGDVAVGAGHSIAEQAQRHIVATELGLHLGQAAHRFDRLDVTRPERERGLGHPYGEVLACLQVVATAAGDPALAEKQPGLQFVVVLVGSRLRSSGRRSTLRARSSSPS